MIIVKYYRLAATFYVLYCHSGEDQETFNSNKEIDDVKAANKKQH